MFGDYCKESASKFVELLTTVMSHSRTTSILLLEMVLAAPVRTDMNLELRKKLEKSV